MCRLLASVVVFVGALCPYAFGQPGPLLDQCLMTCMSKHMQQTGGPADMSKLMSAQTFKVGNMTVICPQVNKSQTEQMDQNCAAFTELKKCTDPCPDSPIKQMTMSGFRMQQFMCVDRKEDYKKNMPCLSDACPDVQKTCAPKCGSLEDAGQKLRALMIRMQGGSMGLPPGIGLMPGAGNTPTGGPSKDVDMKEIIKAVADNCKTIDCHLSCSEDPVTKKCGKEGYQFQRNLIWNMFSSVVQGMSSIGVQSEWPDECKPLVKSISTGVCEKTPCDASTTLVPSILLLVMTLLMGLRRV